MPSDTKELPTHRPFISTPGKWLGPTGIGVHQVTPWYLKHAKHSANKPLRFGSPTSSAQPPGGPRTEPPAPASGWRERLTVVHKLLGSIASSITILTLLIKLLGLLSLLIWPSNLADAVPLASTTVLSDARPPPWFYMISESAVDGSSEPAPAPTPRRWSRPPRSTDPAPPVQPDPTPALDPEPVQPDPDAHTQTPKPDLPHLEDIHPGLPSTWTPPKSTTRRLR